MRPVKHYRRRWLLPILGLTLGSAAGVATVTLAGAAAQPAAVAASHGMLDATHLPPLLTIPGERVDLAYDVHCAISDTESAESLCDLHGNLFVRATGRGVYDRVALTPIPIDGHQQFVATVPELLASRPDGFEYYAVFDAPELGENVTVPAGGAEAPHSSRRLVNAVEVALGRHDFGNARTGTRVASAAWGDGPTDAGLEQGRHVGAIGASSFDVDPSGAVAVLDQANRRLLRWRKGGSVPTRVAISVDGTLADLALANDGSFFVLETAATPGRNPLVRRFDDGGRELEATETAERTASQIRMAPGGPVVLGHPSNHWMPALVNGAPTPPSEQRRRGHPGRLLGTGSRLVVFRHESELRVALVAGRLSTRSWRITSQSSLAEVQLAEPLGQRIVLVVRVYEEQQDEFAVLVLDRKGLVERFALDSADWAETAPLSRFRLVGRHLYQLGSTPAGTFVDRFDVEVR